MKKIIFLMCIVFIVAGCASKRYTKQGEKFEEAGLYKDAGEYYYEAVKRKNSNVDAKLGLRKNGQLTLDAKVDNFMDYYKQGNNQQAVYAYLNAEDYYKKIKKVGVDLHFPENIKSYYEEAKASHLESQYIMGSSRLEYEQFSEAKRIFAGIIDIDPNYKDVKGKYKIARYEPNYRQAIEFLDNGKFRKSYYAFENLLQSAGDYKQAMVLQEEALEKATLVIFVNDFKNAAKVDKALATNLTDKVREQIRELENPFISLKDKESLDVDIYKYGREVDLKAARLAGIHIILNATIQSSLKVESKLKKTTQKGYIKEVIKMVNDDGVEKESVTYHKTNYTEFEAQNEAGLDLKYQFVSTQSGENIMSGRFNRKKDDEVHYVEFEGDKSKLVPGYWKNKERKSAEDVVRDEKKEVKALNRLLVAKRDIDSSHKLLNELLSKCVKEISRKADKYNPEID